MMKDAEAVTEIHAGIGEGHCVDRGFVDRHIGMPGKTLARDGERRGRRIDAVQMSDTAGHQWRPAAAAAAGIEAYRFGRQDFPGEDREILSEHPRHLVVRDAALVEALPLGTEIPHRRAVDILAIAGHRLTL